MKTDKEICNHNMEIMEAHNKAVSSVEDDEVKKLMVLASVLSMKTDKGENVGEVIARMVKTDAEDDG